jgi:hypothetical protein
MRLRKLQKFPKSGEGETKMKTNVMRMFLALGAACIFGSALDAQTYDLSAKVPFAFQVANTTMPAGKYLVGDYGSTGVLVFRNATTGNSVFISGAIHAMDATRPGRLVFRCYGTDACFLAEIWPVTGRGSAVPKGNAEKEIINSDRPREMATISINLRNTE